MQLGSRNLIFVAAPVMDSSDTLAEWLRRRLRVSPRIPNLGLKRAVVAALAAAGRQTLRLFECLVWMSTATADAQVQRPATAQAAPSSRKLASRTRGTRRLVPPPNSRHGVLCAPGSLCTTQKAKPRTTFATPAKSRAQKKWAWSVALALPS